jgi:hypothetical protein
LLTIALCLTLPAHGQFLPRFTILYRESDPKLGQTYDPALNSILPSWITGAGNRDMDYFHSGKRISVTATHSFRRGNNTVWQFPEDSLFSLTATLTDDGTPPRLTFTLATKRKGWYSVGYTGAPSVEPQRLTGVLQPLIWEERRFPDSAYLSMEHMCPLPAAFTETAGEVVGIAADPSCIPFRMATLTNAGFGILVRNDSGQAQPQLFAPVLGGAHSAMQPGDTFTFALRLILEKDSWLNAYENLSRSLYRFHDYRENATASLNETIDNIVDLAMNDTYSGWNADLKAFDYSTDVRGTVKLVSALHPLSIALIRDNPEIYRRRALPMTEFLLSREKYLFTQDEGETNQQPSHFLRGPAAAVSELTGLLAFSQERSSIFGHYALQLYQKARALNLDIVQPAHDWSQALAIYRMTHDRRYLDSALAGARRYCAARIDATPGDFTDAHLGNRNGGQFWTDFSPRWFDLLELYDETHDRSFLNAALYGARVFATHAWMQPVVPNGETLVNAKGILPMGDPWNKTTPRPMKAAPLRLPSWRVSPVGLMPEASNTYDVNPAVLLSPYAAFFLRLAEYTGDPYLHDIARSAVVGRYTNYPGYDINLAYTDIYQRPDYPLRSWQELTYNQIYYNHIWPQIAFLMDYLITDATTRSHGAIDFPSQYAEGYAYLHARVYGSRPGSFFGDSAVMLWMPRGLLTSDNIQINYITARGKNGLYMALMNQSARPQRVHIRFNPDILPVDVGLDYPVTILTKRLTPSILHRGELGLSIPAGGFVALRISGIDVKTRWQQAVFDSTPGPLGADSYGQWPLGEGKVTGMLLSMGRGFTSAYLWLDATEKQLSSASLHYRTGDGHWHMIIDDHYPYEFSIPVDDSLDEMECWIEGKSLNGNTLRTDTIRLNR